MRRGKEKKEIERARGREGGGKREREGGRKREESRRIC